MNNASCMHRVVCRLRVRGALCEIGSHFLTHTHTHTTATSFTTMAVVATVVRYLGFYSLYPLDSTYEDAVRSRQHHKTLHDRLCPFTCAASRRATAGRLVRACKRARYWLTFYRSHTCGGAAKGAKEEGLSAGNMNRAYDLG